MYYIVLFYISQRFATFFRRESFQIRLRGTPIARNRLTSFRIVLYSTTKYPTMDSQEVKRKLLSGNTKKLRRRQLKAFVTEHLEVIDEIQKEGSMTYAELAKQIEEQFLIHCTPVGLRDAVYLVRKARKEEWRNRSVSSDSHHLELLKENRRKRKNREFQEYKKIMDEILPDRESNDLEKSEETYPIMRVQKLE